MQLPNILVTGSVACGKTSLCARVSEVTGLRHIDVGSLVRDRALHCGWDEQHAAYTVDDDKLCDCLEAELATGGCIVDFHSTSTFPVRWFALVLVLSTQKVEENMECEIMQVCLDEVREAWDERQVVELYSDTVQQMDDNADRCAAWLRQWQTEQRTQLT